MSYWGAGFLAAGAAWVMNRFVVQYLGETAIIWVIPWLEEGIKTGVAIFSGAALVFTHGVFGLVEGVHDYLASPRWGMLAGFLSVVSHWFYGWVTVVFYERTSSWLVGLFCAGILHVFWNYVMVRLWK
jgi:hypothetical protein